MMFLNIKRKIYKYTKNKENNKRINKLHKQKLLIFKKDYVYGKDYHYFSGNEIESVDLFIEKLKKILNKNNIVYAIKEEYHTNSYGRTYVYYRVYLNEQAFEELQVQEYEEVESNGKINT